MRSLRVSAIALGIAGALTLGHVHGAKAQDLNLSIGLPGFAFSFNTGDVAYAYVDGYWDYDHHWHRWRNEREREEYRARFAEHYDARAHDRVENHGWREAKREEHVEHREEERREERREERHEEEHDR